MPIDIQTLAPNVAIVALFIWYLTKKDRSQEMMFTELSGKLEQLGHVIASLENRLKNIEIARSHRSDEELTP